MTLIFVLVLVLILAYNNTATGEGVYPIRLDKSNIHGRGIFATRDIREGEIIELVPVILFKRDEVAEGCLLKDYDIRYDENNTAMMFGYGAIYNHSFDNNAQWNFVDDQTLKITAKKDIKNGEEILVSYGRGYWATRGNPST